MGSSLYLTNYQPSILSGSPSNPIEEMGLNDYSWDSWCDIMRIAAAATPNRPLSTSNSPSKKYNFLFVFTTKWKKKWYVYADGAAVFQTTRRGNKIKPQRLTGDWSKEEGKPLPETELCVCTLPMLEWCSKIHNRICNVCVQDSRLYF